MSGSLTPKGLARPLYSILGAALCLFPNFFALAEKEAANARNFVISYINKYFIYIIIILGYRNRHSIS